MEELEDGDLGETLLVDLAILGGEDPEVELLAVGAVLVDGGGDGRVGAHLVLVARVVVVRQGADVPPSIAGPAHLAEVLGVLVDVVHTDLLNFFFHQGTASRGRERKEKGKKPSGFGKGGAHLGTPEALPGDGGNLLVVGGDLDVDHLVILVGLPRVPGPLDLVDLVLAGGNVVGGLEVGQLVAALEILVDVEQQALGASVDGDNVLGEILGKHT